jgi:hypothetical protein
MKTTKFKMFVFPILATLHFFTACTDIDEIDIPATPAPIVIHTYLYPGMDPVAVIVHRAHHIGAGTMPGDIIPLEDAIVKIREEHANTVELVYSSSKQMYVASSAELSIISGRTYFLSVQHASSALIEASVMVPYPHDDFHLLVTDSTTYSSYKEFHLNAYINDVPGTSNFYQLFGTAKGVTICLSDPGYEEEPFESSIFDFSPLLSDENRDGQPIFQIGYFYEGRSTFPQQCEPYPQHIKLRLYSLDEHAFRYLKSIEEFDEAAGNPFIEPVIIYTNLKNAEGVFGAFAWHEKELSWSALQ